MSVYEKISGFADEISQDFDQQLKTVTDLGMKYICIRSAEHKGIADYTPEEVRTVLLPKLRAAGVGVSSLGTAIGKVEVDDEEGFAKQLEQLETLCETAKLLDCSFIRMFSFLIPKDADADSYTDVVLDKLRQFIRIAEKHDIVLLHENEKGIYGDTGARCNCCSTGWPAPTSRRRSILPTLFSVSRTPRSAGNCSMTRSFISTSRMLCPAAC